MGVYESQSCWLLCHPFEFCFPELTSYHWCFCLATWMTSSRRKEMWMILFGFCQRIWWGHKQPRLWCDLSCRYQTKLRGPIAIYCQFENIHVLFFVTIKSVFCFEPSKSVWHPQIFLFSYHMPCPLDMYEQLHSPKNVGRIFLDEFSLRHFCRWTVFLSKHLYTCSSLMSTLSCIWFLHCNSCTVWLDQIQLMKSSPRLQ